MIDEEIKLENFTNSWKINFLVEKAKLENNLKNYNPKIEHFGSTSVPGVVAKPIIDILIGIKNLIINEEIITTLKRADYEYLGEAGIHGRFAFKRRNSIDYNLAVVELNSDLFRNNILVRDYLKDHSEIALEYSKYKKEIFKKGVKMLIEYSDQKSDFMKNLEKQAISYFKKES